VSEADNLVSVKYVSFDELLASGDLIPIHFRLSSSTYHLINAKEFEMMKKVVVIVNSARGPIFDEAAMASTPDSTNIAVAGRSGTKW
jgi:glyoxylate reductase